MLLLFFSLLIIAVLAAIASRHTKMATATSLLKSLIVPPASGQAPTATLIFAHGLGDSGAGWLDVAQLLSRRPALRHVRFVLPNAPVQPVTLNMGMSMPSWFDIHSLDDFEEHEDEAGLKKSAAAIGALVKAEVDGTAEGLNGRGVPVERVAVGGFSQVSERRRQGVLQSAAAEAWQGAAREIALRSSPPGHIVGIGVDLIHLPRLAKLLARRPGGEKRVHHFGRRILCRSEQDELRDISNAETARLHTWLAVRWAAKEAAYKALYPHLRVRWSDLHVDKARGVKPAMRFSAESEVPVAARPGLDLSISHDGDYVVAFVVATRGDASEAGEAG